MESCFTNVLCHNNDIYCKLVSSYVWKCKNYKYAKYTFFYIKNVLYADIATITAKLMT